MIRRILLSRQNCLLSLAILAFCLFHPPTGLGLDLCLWHRVTGLPCPGCGLTRSLSCCVRGEFGRAAAWHPFGPGFFGLFVLGGGLGLLRARPRARLARWLAGRDRPLRVAYMRFVVCFVAFGFLRMGCEFARHPTTCARSTGAWRSGAALCLGAGYSP